LQNTIFVHVLIYRWNAIFMRNMLFSSLVMASVGKGFPCNNGHNLLFKNLSINFEAGKSYALTGVSGVGKSTLLNMLAGLEAPDCGSVTYEGQDISQMSAEQHEQFLQKTIGIVFQDARLLSCLSVVENVMLKGLIAGTDDYQAQRDKAIGLLAQVGLTNFAQRMPSTLSRGQKQRVAVARALFTDPLFLLADEPTASLGAEDANTLVTILKNLQYAYGMGIIMSTHDMFIANKMEHVVQIVDHQLRFATKE
jgi:ABC-type lipoprotein export system ATPase subunit